MSDDRSRILQVAPLHQPLDRLLGLDAAREQRAEVGQRAPAVGHEQQGALTLAERALPGLEFVACLLGLGGEHGSHSFRRSKAAASLQVVTSS
ncbi:hypothetical protein D9M69_623520 [compost metagenome]